MPRAGGQREEPETAMSRNDVTNQEAKYHPMRSEVAIREDGVVLPVQTRGRRRSSWSLNVRR
jgi:hypothetical protein